MNMHTDKDGIMVVDGERWPPGWGMCCNTIDDFSASFDYERRFRSGECLIVWEDKPGSWGFCIDDGPERVHKSEPIYASGVVAALAADEAAADFLPAVVLAIANRKPRLPITAEELWMCRNVGSGRCVCCGVETGSVVMADGKAVAYCRRCLAEVTP
jgi:hypothetical protein